jgi:hypothetical protein
MGSNKFFASVSASLHGKKSPRQHGTAVIAGIVDFFLAAWPF